jgi:hypothetical protein
MSARITILSLCKYAAGGFVIANEIRGIVFAAPVFVTLYKTGGTLMAIGLACCALAGIAASVYLPILALKKMQRRAAKPVEDHPNKIGSMF